MTDDLKPITITNAQPQVLSPSPVPGEELPKRRAEDTATYTNEWIILISALSVWGVSFFADMAAYETWNEMLTPKFIGIHGGQLVGAVVAVVAAKRMKN